MNSDIGGPPFYGDTMTDPLKTGDPTKICPEFEPERPLHATLIEDILYALENNHYIGWDHADGRICPKGLVVGNLPSQEPTCNNILNGGPE